MSAVFSGYDNSCFRFLLRDSQEKAKTILMQKWGGGGGVNKVYYVKYELGDCDLIIRKTIL